MSKIKNQKITNLRNRSVLPSIILFLVSIVLGATLVGITVSSIFIYMLETKYIEYNKETLNLKNTVEQKRNASVPFETIFSSIENETIHPLAITVLDKDNKIIYSYGDLFEVKSSVVIENDINIRLFKRSKKITQDTIFIDINDILHNFAKILDDTGGEGIVFDDLDRKLYSFKYWIKKSIDTDEASLFVEYVQYIEMNDCIIILIVLGVSTVVLFLLICFNFINALANISSQRKTLKLLMKDTKTGGNNYLAFTNYSLKDIRKFRNRKKKYALIDLSLSKYHSYCSLYGTLEGERVLTNIYNCLGKFLNKDEIHASISNGDFILLLKIDSEENDEQKLLNRINAIIKNVPEMLRVNNERFYLDLKGLSNLKFKAGVYFINPVVDEDSKERRRNLNVDQLYIKAGIAKQGLTEDSGVIVYNHEMLEKELWDQKVQDNMQAALQAKEFQVYIQPKYHPSTEELVGGEALVRWISPKEGFISPGKFIPIFEKTGFITKLDDYMILHTAELQAKWLEQGKKIVPISVNVSRAHFAQPDLAEHIKRLVDTYPIPHKYIEIELTESAFFDDKKALLTTVKKLQEYGFEVSMDDFGAGYSSLNSLKDLPLNVLKLDAEFFRGEVFDSRGEIVVSEAISLAKQLDMRIVAEGVEKKEQVDFLAAQKCDMIQGFYFAKPMPADEYEGRMEQVTKVTSEE